ncbi:transglycosylase SLT domain-containing protein [Thiothrix lacustris]|uniref:transglycosylase SLT domain-containing protein n=1 Tax=Thiothrix lacustris TaxID=525917 RepID=UPI000687D7B1|nr:transglycosylase SLT domain-containing protein [Thiothrix lacustris]
MSNLEVNLKITANTSQARNQLDALGSSVRPVKLNVNDADVQRALDALARLSGAGSDQMLNIDANTAGIDDALRLLRELSAEAGADHNIEVGADTQALDDAMSRIEQLEQQLNGAGAQATGFMGVLKGVGGALLAAFTVDAIAANTVDLIKFNTEINQMNEYLFVSREALQVWGNAGKQYGVEIADVLKDIQEKIGEFAATGGGEAADVFKELSLSAQELINLSPDQQLLKVAEAMSKVKDMSQGEKSFLLESLGNDATKLLPLLDNNAAKLREIDAIMRESGAIITADQNEVLTEAAHNLMLLETALSGVSNAMGMAGASIFNTFGEAAASAIAATTTSLTEMAAVAVDEGAAIGDAWSMAFANMPPAAEAAAQAAGDAWAWIGDAFDWVLSGLGQGVGELVELFRIGFTYLPQFAVAAFQALIDYGMSWVHTGSAGFELVKSVASNVFVSLVEFAGKGFGAIASIAGKVIGWVIDKLAAMAGAVSSALASVADVPGMEGLSAKAASAEASLRSMAGSARGAGDAVTGGFKAMADGIRASANESASAAKISALQATTSKLSAQHALANAHAMMVESEGNRERTIEMGKAERQFAKLGSSIDGAGASGKKYRVDQEAVNKALDDGTGATKAKSAADKKSIEVTHEHGDALKSVIESLTKQRIELEQGKLAAEYYTQRLNGLTEAEAKAATGAGQYNNYLAERKKLAEEAVGITGGLVDQYNLELSNAGLVIADDFSAAESAASKAIKAAEQYNTAISNASKTFESTRDGVTTGAVGKLAKTTSDFDALIQKASQASGVSAAFIKAIAQQETGYLQDPDRRARAVSPVGAGGVMQIMPDTGRGLGITPAERFDPEKNIMAGAQYLKQMLAKFGGSEALAAAAYNAGPGAVGKYNGVPPYKETQNYVRKVAAYTDLYRTNTEAAQKVVAASVPYWETLESTAAKTETTLVEYSGSFDGARVTADQLHGLINDKMGNAAKQLIKSATDHTAEVTLTGEAYRRQQLNALQYNQIVLSGNKTLADAILLDEQAANYATEKAKLEQDAFTARNGMAAQYSRELEKQNLSQEQIADLVQRKMVAETAKILHDTEQQTRQLSLSADAWQRIALAQDGYNDAQIDSIRQAEKLLEKTKQIRAAADKIGNGLLDGLMSAVTDGGDLAESLAQTFETAFSDLVLRPTIEPITQAISDGLTGVMTGQESPWSGLQQAYSSSMTSMQAGGWGGAATSAGLAMSASAILGGSQQQQIGAGIGGAAGNALAMAMSASGPIGMALGALAGHFAGGLFEDDDSPRAAFTGGTPTDGWRTGGGRNLYAESKLGTFGFQEHGTHDLGSEGEAKLQAFIKQMTQVDDALVKFLPTAEVERIKAELANYTHTGLDLDQLFVDRLRIISSGFDESFKSLINFNGSAEEVLSRINDLFTMRDAVVPVLQTLGLNLGYTKEASLAATAGLADVAGGLQNLVAANDYYLQNFFGDEERRQVIIDSARQRLESWSESIGYAGTALIDTKDEFRAYIESLDLTTIAGQEAYVGAMQYANAIVSLTDAMGAGTGVAGDLSTFLQNGVPVALAGYTKTAPAVSEMDALPQYAIGSDYVQGDQAAVIHNSEMIFSASQSASLRDNVVSIVRSSRQAGAVSGNSDALVSKLDELLKEIRGLNNTANAARRDSNQYSAFAIQQRRDIVDDQRRLVAKATYTPVTEGDYA